MRNFAFDSDVVKYAELADRGLTVLPVDSLTSSLLACPSSACAGTSLLAVLVVVVDFNFVVVIVVVCDVAVFDAVTLGLCVTSSLNKPLT